MPEIVPSPVVTSVVLAPLHIENALIVDYDTSRFDFRSWASELLCVSRLEDLHQRPDLGRFSHFDLVRQIDACRLVLVDAFPTLATLFRSFVHDAIGPHVGGVRAFQTPPSFRIHYAGRGSSSIHRDRDYGVLADRLNAWVPLTRVSDENSLYVESREGKGDLQPVSLNYGQMLIFDGGNLLHGSHFNVTRSTRVSFDLRFMPGVLQG
jgi:hypothetical protein